MQLSLEKELGIKPQGNRKFLRVIEDDKYNTASTFRLFETVKVSFIIELMEGI